MQSWFGFCRRKTCDKEALTFIPNQLTLPNSPIANWILCCFSKQFFFFIRLKTPIIKTSQVQEGTILRLRMVQVRSSCKTFRQLRERELQAATWHWHCQTMEDPSQIVSLKTAELDFFVFVFMAADEDYIQIRCIKPLPRLR